MTEIKKCDSLNEVYDIHIPTPYNIIVLLYTSIIIILYIMYTPYVALAAHSAAAT